MNGMNGYSNEETFYAALYASNNYVAYQWALHVDRIDYLDSHEKVSYWLSMSGNYIKGTLGKNDIIIENDRFTRAGMKQNDNLFGWLKSQLQDFDFNNVNLAEVYQDVIGCD